MKHAKMILGGLPDGLGRDCDMLRGGRRGIGDNF